MLRTGTVGQRRSFSRMHAELAMQCGVVPHPCGYVPLSVFWIDVITTGSTTLQPFA